MKVKELIEKLNTFPQDLIVKDDCGEEIINPVLVNSFTEKFVVLECSPIRNYNNLEVIEI